jgi:hypothetical protein
VSAKGSSRKPTRCRPVLTYEYSHTRRIRVPLDADRKLLFIHIPKTAGKSVEAALEIATKAETEKYRWRSTLNRGLTWAQRVTADKRSEERLWGVLDYTFMAQHLTYAEVYLLGLCPGDITEYSKLAVCRNPYDRAVSMFFHLAPSAEKTPQGFEIFIRTWLESDPPERHGFRTILRPQWEFCVDLNGESVLDTVLRFERLGEDYARYCREVLDQPAELPWLGKQRHDRDHDQFYTATTRKTVRRLFARDFEMFGYPTY